MSPPSLSRRSLLKAGAATGALALAGCSAKPPSGDLSWSMWSSSAAEDAVWADFSAYVEKTLGRRSIANLTPSSGYPTKMDLQLVSGTQSMVHAVNGFLVPTYAARGALRPIDDLIAGMDLTDFLPDIHAMSGFGGHQYGLGFDVAPMVLYVNKTLFAANGIPLPPSDRPMTWDEFREVGAAFAQKPGQYGFTHAPAIDDLISWLYSAGADVMNEEQSVSTLHLPEAEYALRFVVDLFTKDGIAPPITNLVTVNATGNFLDGNVAMMQNGPWQVLNVRKAKFEWDVVPFPAGPAGSLPRVSGSAFTIPAGTSDVEAAWQLLTTLTSTPALDIYARAGRNNPARRSASNAFEPPPANLGIVQQILAGELPGAGGHRYVTTTNWNEVRQITAQELPRSYLGQRDIAETVEVLRPRLDALMVQNTDNIRQMNARRR